MRFFRIVCLFGPILLMGLAKNLNSYDVKKIKKTIEREVSKLEQILERKDLLERVANQNKELPKILQSVTNENWQNYNGNSDVVQYLEKSVLVDELKKEMPFYVSEFFVSDQSGKKVLFFEKTSKFDHKNVEKFQVPATGKVWIGQMERDESSGVHQIQVGLPIWSRNKIIGVAVFGLSIVRLEDIVN